jgi:uncharacterized membrane protein (DUF4010 family)
LAQIWRHMQAAVKSTLGTSLGPQIGFLIALALLLLVLPDRLLHESFPVNPFRAVRLILLISMIQVFGYLMSRAVGTRFGLPISGLISGFISSVATHSTMANRARQAPQLKRACISAALLSNVATGLQAIAIVSALTPHYLHLLAPYLSLMVIAAALLGFSALGTIAGSASEVPSNRVLSVRHSLLFGALLTAASAITLFLQREWGTSAVIVSVLLSALIDVHVAISALLSASFASTEQTPPALVPGLLLCLTINATMKVGVTFAGAGRGRYSYEMLCALALMAAAPWVYWLLA